MRTRHGQFEFNTAQSLAWVRRSLEQEFHEVRREQPALLRLALNEAEALAGETGYPQLLFPALAREKAEQTGAWLQRQRNVRRKSPSIAFGA
jgi:hypothetical protein